MSEEVRNWLDGALDIHVHAAPSLFTRWGDGLDVVEACAAAGMAGVLLKAHEGSTVESAAVLNRLSGTMRVYGGIVLNRYVGGLNPPAVEAALRLGARCVWFPTLDADAHARAFGSTGVYPVQRGGNESPHGIRILDERGACVREAREVLDLAAEHNVLVATGHLANDEIVALLKAATEAGCHRLLVQHVGFPIPGLGAESLKPLVRAGAVLELTYLSISPMWQTSTIEQAVALLTSFGGENVVLSSDAGQLHNPSPPEALRSFAQSLYERGAPATDVEKALTGTPRKLICD